MSVKDQIKTTLVTSKSIGLTEEPTIKPTAKPTENYYKYYDAERYTMLMDKNKAKRRNSNCQKEGKIYRAKKQ